jgi:predicted RNase H-like HicB family nuclease
MLRGGGMNLVNPLLQKHETVVTFVVEQQVSGRFGASVMEFPGCRAEADTKEAAIAQVQTQLQVYLAQVELIQVALPARPEAGDGWDRLFGVFKGDPDFAEIAAEIRAVREVDDDSEVDPAVYESR